VSGFVPAACLALAGCTDDSEILGCNSGFIVNVAANEVVLRIGERREVVTRAVDPCAASIYKPVAWSADDYRIVGIMISSDSSAILIGQRTGRTVVRAVPQRDIPRADVAWTNFAVTVTP
jgi:hypothetical protein